MIVRPLRALLLATLWLCLIVPATNLHASVQATITVQLTSDLPSGQPVGTTVIWTVAASGATAPEYRLSVKAPGTATRVMVDFTDRTSFEWTSLEEGTHGVIVSVRDRTTGAVVHAGQSFVLNSRATSGPVVSATSHPLVALYSAPPCTTGAVFVAWQLAAGGPVSYSPPRACRSGRSSNIYVAGMRPNTDYRVTHLVVEGGVVLERGPAFIHRTGTVPVTLPTVTVLDPPDEFTSAEQVLFQVPGIAPPGVPLVSFATDLAGRVLWYDATATNPAIVVRAFRPVDGGTTLVTYGDGPVPDQTLREVSLAGHVVRETNTRRISDQLAVLGQDPFRSFHHEARRLPDGRTLVLGSVERILTDVQGAGPVDVIGDYIVVLDKNWQVTWAWNSFDHLDVRRMATLNETCVPNQGGCPPLFLDDIANDWTHGNAIAYSPSDGNLLFSMRHQDWVVKIDYRDGAGVGDVIWRLGPEGDFTIQSTDPDPWFSHQHDPNFLPNGDLAIYDNSNLRCVRRGQCNSRGQVYRLDESAMTATLVLNTDLRNYSAALGSAQPLLNGNILFGSGFRNPPNFTSTADEIRPDGSTTYSPRTSQAIYRSFRMTDLFNAPP
jgi:arylsulfate sulfotransferase